VYSGEEGEEGQTDQLDGRHHDVLCVSDTIVDNVEDVSDVCCGV
jgi:hypothetical protein